MRAFRFMDPLDRKACRRALATRDARWDGLLFVGVASTGVYCRPVCPAGPAREENLRFFASAAAAHRAGFRPCLRCRPETAPDIPFGPGTARTVSRALSLIATGALDDGEASVDALAQRLGVGSSQLRGLFEQQLGASPLAVAEARRVLFATQLLHETRLEVSEVARAAGFSSVRRFNETFRTLFRRPPSSLRRTRNWSRPGATSAAQAGTTLRLKYRPPYDWGAILGHLAARAIPGVERLAGDAYERTVCENGLSGTVLVRHEPLRDSLVVTVRLPCVRALSVILARVRCVFDPGADVLTIGTHLARDPFLRRLVAQRPGLRVPGGWDGFELAVRAVLGQQVSVAAARNLAGRLVEICGTALAGASDQALSRVFPLAEQVAAADLGALGMPASRRATLQALATAAVADPDLFRPSGSIEDGIARLRSIRGVGEWTAQYIALRALRETDAFPASDIGLLRAAATRDGLRPTPAELLRRASAWQPWRAYAAQHLWAADAARGSGRSVERTPQNRKA